MNLRRLAAAAVVLGAIVPVAVSAASGAPSLATCTGTVVWVNYGSGVACTPTSNQQVNVRFLPSSWSLKHAHNYCTGVGGDAVHTLYANTANVCTNVDPALLPGGVPSTSSTTTTTAVTTVPASSSSTSSTSLPPTSSTSTSTTTSSSSTSTTTPSGTCSGAQHTPGGPDRWGGCWPGPNNTGVPAGVTLTAYTGPCTITTAGTVIDGKTVNCDLDINAANVTVRRSRINGTIHTNSTGTVLTDIFVNASPNGPSYWSGVEGSNYTATRVHTIGGIRGFWCEHNCVIQDSYIHGQVVTADWHAGGIRLSQNGRLTHNTIWCEPQPTPQDGGCSADLTGYPDFEPYNHNTVERNLLMANPTGISYCMYGGGSGPKPYTNDPTNATYVVVRDNVWQRGSNGKCGAYGPVTDYITGRVGNVWSGNQWDNGSTVPPG